MANTERFNTLQKLVLARKKAGKLRSNSKLNSNEQAEVDAAYDALVEAEDLLILEDIQKSIAAMKTSAKQLAKIAKDFSNAADKLKQLAEWIADAAQALGVLADIVTKAAGAGII